MTEQVSRLQTTNLADLLERVLDKGVVIVGDIKINLVEVELLTIKIRLLIASVDKAKAIGINWWEHDPFISVPQRTVAKPGIQSEQEDEKNEGHRTN